MSETHLLPPAARSPHGPRRVEIKRSPEKSAASDGRPGAPRGPPVPEISVSPRVFRIADVCRLLGLSRTSVYKLIGLGQLPTIKICGRVLVPAEAIDGLIDAAIAETPAPGK
jgi:excisionase family DNA binding protein